MILKLFKPLWGHQGTLREAVRQAAEASFSGIEGPPPKSKSDRNAFDADLKENGLEYIAEVVTGGDYVPDPTLDPSRHLDDLRKGIERSLSLDPLFINTMTGLDAWPMTKQVTYFEKVLELQDQYDLTITVETHRSRSTYTPWQTAELLRYLPGLKLNCDFSHWCCVSERLVLNDDPDLFYLFMKACRHLHARIGYAQGPQVPDPRAPEYATEVEAHFRWWKHVWNFMEACGRESVTMTPEFGPDGYLHQEPYTQEPVADLWEVNCWMAGELREAFAARTSSSMTATQLS